MGEGHVLASPAPPLHRSHGATLSAWKHDEPSSGGTSPPSARRCSCAATSHPFALTGAWAGGGALIGSEPVRVAGPGEDPFALLDLDAVRGPGRARRLGGVAGLPARSAGGAAGPRAAAARRRCPDFELAFYDHLLRLDADGRWWFECLWTPERAGRAGRARGRAARAGRRATAVLDRALALGARARAATSWPWPPRASASTRATCSRPTCACGWSRGSTGDPLDLFAAGVAGAGAGPGRVRGRPGRHGGGQPVARAVPGAPRPPGAHGADQGHAPPLRRPGRAGALAQGPRREHDDRGPDAQRPGAGVRARHGDRGRAGAGAPARGRLAPGVRGLGPSCATARATPTWCARASRRAR